MKRQIIESNIHRFEVLWLGEFANWVVTGLMEI
jgi:hypothetical protein